MLFLIAVCIGLIIYGIIVSLCGPGAARKDTVRGRVDKLGKDNDRSRFPDNEELDKPFAERILKPLLQKITQLLSNLVPSKKGNNKEKLQQMLNHAGWTISTDEYTAIQMILMIGGGLLGTMLGVVSHSALSDILMYFFLGAFGAFALLRYFCTSTGSRRKENMEKQLPDMLDLLSVSVAAGLGFERAMLHIIETMDGPLIDEFAVAYREMSMGRSRKDALTLLADRCGVEELSSVTGAIVQAGQLGIPMRNVLQSQAAAIRRGRRAKTQEKAAKVSTKIVLPMVAFIFPVLLIVLMGPSLITIMKNFK